MSSRSWVEIDEARLVANYGVVREAAGEHTDVLAVVKANAYGHGLEQCAVALARAGGLNPTWLGVGDAAEGMRARRALEAAGLSRGYVEILVMCGVMREEVSAIAEYGLTPVVWTREQVGWLAESAQAHGVAMRVHVEIDTGMSRQGVRPEQLEGLLGAIKAAGLELDGVMTHFHSAEIAGSEQTREQKKRFEGAVAHVAAASLKPQWVHAGSSSSVDVGDDSAWLEGLAMSVGARAMVRSGIALYGYALPAQGGESRIRAKLKPVMTWKTRVLDVREVAAGEGIGYNATYIAKQPMRVALLPVGYADGLRRELSGSETRAGGWVMVRGADDALRRANILGRVSMNLAVIDLSGVDATEIDSTEARAVRVGDEVVLLGDGITTDDHARIAGTIPYEILCGVRATP